MLLPHRQDATLYAINHAKVKLACNCPHWWNAWFRLATTRPESVQRRHKLIVKCATLRNSNASCSFRTDKTHFDRKIKSILRNSNTLCDNTSRFCTDMHTVILTQLSTLMKRMIPSCYNMPRICTEEATLIVKWNQWASFDAAVDVDESHDSILQQNAKNLYRQDTSWL